MPVQGNLVGGVYAKHYCNTTSQRMEIQALIHALEYGAKLVITDSQYVVGGFSGEWRLKANIDLWGEVFDLSYGVEVRYQPRNSDRFQKIVDTAAKRASLGLNIT